MNVWLCPVKLKNWKIIKRVKTFGVHKRALKSLGRVRPGDLLVFHVLNPVNGIAAVCKVKSDVFESHEDIWGKDRYPLRVKIEFISKLLWDEGKPIRLSSLFGKIDYEEGIVVEPYLRNVCIIKISDTEYQKLMRLSMLR